MVVVAFGAPGVPVVSWALAKEVSAVPIIRLSVSVSRLVLMGVLPTLPFLSSVF
jgi:L-lactate permease